MRVLMTGGYGCIGSWVAKQLADAGQEVWIYDLKRRHSSPGLDPRTRADARRSISWRETYPTSTRSDRPSNALGRPISSIWLACKPPPARLTRILGAKVNVLGTLAVFETALALKDQVQRVVYASSAAVHGPPDDSTHGSVADLVRLAPLTHYGAFKVCNELNARVYWLDHGITSIGLRPWTVYGVGRDFGMTSEPTKAIKAAALGRPYRISYGGKQDLQYVGDVAATFMRALTQPFEGADAFNLRGAVEPIEAFVNAFCETVPAAHDLVTHGDRQLPIAPDLDDSRLQERLGPIPRTPLRDGIAETYHRFVALHRDGRLDESDQ